MRQGRQFLGNAGLFQTGPDMVQPQTRANQTFPKPVRQTLLHAQMRAGNRQLLLAYLAGPQCQHAHFLGTQALPFAICQGSENGLVSARGPLIGLATLAAAHAGIQLYHPVYHAKILVVVYDPLSGAVFGKDATPELNVWLQAWRPCQQVSLNRGNVKCQQTEQGGCWRQTSNEGCGFCHEYGTAGSGTVVRNYRCFGSGNPDIPLQSAANLPVGKFPFV